MSAFAQTFEDVEIFSLMHIPLVSNLGASMEC